MTMTLLRATFLSAAIAIAGAWLFHGITDRRVSAGYWLALACVHATVVMPACMRVVRARR